LNLSGGPERSVGKFLFIGFWPFNLLLK